MLKDRKIESSTTCWYSSVLFATKKDGSVRFCVGYRRLTAVTVRKSFFILDKNDYIGSMRNTMLLLTPDSPLRSRSRDERKEFRQNCLHDSLRIMLVHGHVVRAGDALAALKRAIDVILATVKCPQSLLHINDAILLSRSPERDARHV